MAIRRNQNTLTASDIEDALRACFTSSNPYRRPLNIMDLGLVDRIELLPDQDAPGSGISGVPSRQTLSLSLLPPTIDEDANAILLAQVQNRLAGLPQLSRISVAWIQGHAWTETRLSSRLRRELNSTFAILNNQKGLRS